MASNTHLLRRRGRMSTIADMMRDGRVVTALALSKATGASERTIYRDIKLLLADGVKIVGEAGVGYVWKPSEELNDG